MARTKVPELIGEAFAPPPGVATTAPPDSAPPDSAPTAEPAPTEEPAPTLESAS
jgi:hypothetical protein